MSAAGLIMLILFLIAVGMVFYYAALCYQSRALRGKKPEYSDMGPLLSNEQDLNGNHESESVAPFVVASLGSPDNESGPKDVDELDEISPACSELQKPPHQPLNHHSAPECASSAPNGNNTIILTMEEEPFLSHAKSLRDPTTSTPLHCNEKGIKEPLRAIDIPVLCSESPSRQAMSVSFEEDGLLVPRTSISRVSDTLPSSPPAQNTSKLLDETVDSSNQAHLSFLPPMASSNLSSNKVQESSGDDTNVPVFHFASSDTDGKQDPAKTFSPKCERQNSEPPCKKTKISPIEDFCTSENFKKILSSSIPVDISHQADRDDTELDVSVPVFNQISNSEENDGITEDKCEDKVPNEVMDQLDENPSESSIAKDIISESSIIPDTINAADNEKKSETIPKMDSNDAIPESHNRDKENKNACVNKIGWNVSLGSDNELSKPDEITDIEHANIPVSNASEKTPDTDSDSSSDPEVTEYSFREGSPLPSTTAVLAGEVGSYSEDIVDLTHYTPLDGTTPCPNDSNHRVESEKVEALVLVNPSAAEIEVVVEAPVTETSVVKTTHSRSLSSSSSSSSSSSASNGSYAVDPPKGDLKGAKKPVQMK